MSTNHPPLAGDSIWSEQQRFEDEESWRRTMGRRSPEWMKSRNEPCPCIVKPELIAVHTVLFIVEWCFFQCPCCGKTWKKQVGK